LSVVMIMMLELLTVVMMKLDAGTKILIVMITIYAPLTPAMSLQVVYIPLLYVLNLMLAILSVVNN